MKKEVDRFCFLVNKDYFSTEETLNMVDDLCRKYGTEAVTWHMIQNHPETIDKIERMCK